MKSIYLSEKEFAKLAKSKKNIKSFPNPDYKEIDGVSYMIIRDGEICSTKILSEDDKKWYCGVKTEEDVVELRVDKMCCFPTELVADTQPRIVSGVIRSGFSMDTELSRKTGWLYSAGTLGSRGDLFLKSKVNEAIKILNKNGFSFTTI